MAAASKLLRLILFVLSAMIPTIALAETIPAISEAVTPTASVYRPASSASDFSGVPCTAIIDNDYSPVCALFMAEYPIHDTANRRYEAVQLSCGASGISVHEKMYGSDGQFITEYDWTYSWSSCSNFSCPSGFTQSGSSCVRYSCPLNQEWTLSGSNCIREDCALGMYRYINGQCSYEKELGEKCEE